MLYITSNQHEVRLHLVLIYADPQTVKSTKLYKQH